MHDSIIFESRTTLSWFLRCETLLIIEMDLWQYLHVSTDVSKNQALTSPIHSLNKDVWPVYYVTVMTTCTMMMTTRDQEEKGNTSLVVAVSSESEEDMVGEEKLL